MTITEQQTPPTFLVQTEDDGVRMENSLYHYYLALKNAHITCRDASLPHADGGHWLWVENAIPSMPSATGLRAPKNGCAGVVFFWN